LAELTGLESGNYQPMPKSEPKPIEPPPSWLLNPPRYPVGVAEWQKYAPLPESLILEKRLCVGVLPKSQCRHKRLIVPVLDGGLLVGLRGRAIRCSCPKWLAPGGTKLSRYTLYNIDAVRPGSVVIIVENPIDALLIGLADPGAVGVGTYSTSYWRDDWTKTLVAAKPRMVFVAFDNDLPGNGGAARRPEMVRDWMRTHDRIPQARGIKLTNELQRALPAELYDWGNAPVGADMRSEL